MKHSQWYSQKLHDFQYACRHSSWGCVQYKEEEKLRDALQGRRVANLLKYLKYILFEATLVQLLV